MSDIRFYHLTTLPLPKALPKLLEKVIEKDLRVLVYSASSSQIEELNNSMWSYSQKEFLPHGTKADGFLEEQPIYLSTAVNDNPNGATVLAVVDGTDVEVFGEGFSQTIDMFDGNDPDQVAAARERWTRYKNAGHDLTYWKQNAKGAWEKGA